MVFFLFSFFFFGGTVASTQILMLAKQVFYNTMVFNNSTGVPQCKYKQVSFSRCLQN
jgi:hypothetical protein